MQNNFPLSALKQLAKGILPSALLNWRKSYIATTSRSQYAKLTTKEIFSKIYEDGAWGKSPDQEHKYFSGNGSHDRSIVNPYVIAVEKFLSSFEKKPNVVDLGCGDFSVGSKLRHLCDKYIACDIVESVINFNKEKYQGLDVDFRTLDLTRDALPEGEIVFIRQVLQHLSNDKISAALPRIASKYKYLVLTEHLPSTRSFAHNIDKPAGPDIRLYFNSGLILTSAPFNLKVKEDICLCEVAEYGGIIRTTLYRLL